jgi:glutamate-1-semialdehyde 2,1-aminomutase
MSGHGTEVDRSRLQASFEREQERFEELHVRSRDLTRQARGSLLDAVPMPFMTEWPGSFPVYVAEAAGSRVIDVDGIGYADFCLGDTGAMTGHSPPSVAAALAERAPEGVTYMLPTADSIAAGMELQRRFGVEYWQFTVSATDANRFAMRIARKVTGRSRVLVFNWCYHGTVDEASVAMVEGKVQAREPNSGQPVSPELTTRVVEFNDLDALEQALREQDIACVLAEPAMTNVGIVGPDSGFHEAMRELTRRYGTLLIIDETHTLSAGPGGCTAEWDLDPDMVVLGKAIASGIPTGTYGLSEEVAARLSAQRGPEVSVTGGIGGTLAGNALSARALRITLETVLTQESFEGMIRQAQRYQAGVEQAIQALGLPWHVARLGCRAEYRYQPVPPQNGSESMAADDRRLAAFMHLFALNRGVLLTPFHNMVLMCPETTDQQVDRAIDTFAGATAEVVA